MTLTILCLLGGTLSHDDGLHHACPCLQVLLSLGVSRQFRTLRDHEGAEITKKDLVLLGMLGQGERDHAPP